MQLLRSEGVEMGDVPSPPEYKGTLSKGREVIKAEEDEGWQEYVYVV